MLFKILFFSKLDILFILKIKSKNLKDKLFYVLVRECHEFFSLQLTCVNQ